MILSAVPKSFFGGDTVRFTIDLPDHPAPTWDTTFYMENADGQFSKAGVDSGSSHAFVLSAADTAALKAGKFRWSIRATDGSVVETADAGGWLEVEPDPAATGARDRRTWAQRTLEALEATIEGRASTDQLSMSINGRSISRLSPAELTEWRNQLRAEVRAEEQAANAGLGRHVRVRLGRA